MEPFARSFLKASLVWLALGVTLGVAMAAHPNWSVHRMAHLHMLLLGFVGMMIFGVAYHVIPRFTGHPLASRRAGIVHWWVANAGLALMVAGFMTRGLGRGAGTPLLATGGMLSSIGAYVFVVVLWRTMDGPPELRAAERRAREAVQRARASAMPIAPS